jgi:hypothetical protein
MQGLGKPVPCRFRNPSICSEWRSETGSPVTPKGFWWFMEWNGCLLPAHAVHSSASAFKDSTHVLS